MAYAELAGLPAITGLYTTVVCLVAYALVGPSPILVLGPDSALGPMIAATILPLAAGDEQQAIALAGHARAPRRAPSPSAPACSSWGSSPTCSRTRSGPATWRASPWSSSSASCPSCSASRPMRAASSRRLARVPRRASDETNPWALGIGLLSLGIILGLKTASRPRRPASSSRVVVAIALSIVLDLAARGVSVIGVLPQGFPVPSLPAAPLSRPPAADRRRAIGISLVAIGDTISVSGGFASRARLRGGRQPGARGHRRRRTSRPASSRGFPVSTSGSRTAVAVPVRAPRPS